MNHKKFVILVNREAGSGGKEIAERLGALLNVNVYSKAAIDGLIKHFNLSEEEIEHIRSRKQNWWDEVCQFHRQFAAASDPLAVDREVTPMQLYHTEAKLLKELAAEESCIIVGRAGFHIFKDTPEALKIFIIADRKDRVERISNKLQMSAKEAEKTIDEIDKQRENFTMTFAGVSRYDARNYDMVFNLSHVGADMVVDSIASYINKNFKN